MTTRAITVRAGAAVSLALATTLALAGCGPAPWTYGETGGPDASATPTTVPTVAPPVPNDLSSGATERELQAGAVSATVNYWSTLAMDRWTPAEVKPISLSMVTTVTPDDGQKVYLQKATMTVVPADATETFAPLETQADIASVNPGYLVIAPYSYSQTFTVGPVPDAATHVTLQFTYDFLVQTTPTSSEYAKQTSTDTLTMRLEPAPDAGDASAGS